MTRGLVRWFDHWLDDPAPADRPRVCTCAITGPDRCPRHRDLTEGEA